MKITQNSVGIFHYRLDDAEGNELESSQGGDPMAYLHGHGNIISGLEKAMLDKEKGDTFSVTLEAKDAYGERVEDATQRVPIKHLMGNKKQKSNLRPGHIVSVQTEEGPRQATVIKAGKFNVDLDVNHPLAGKALTFHITIEDVREASEEEIAHKHAHGPGGHQH